MADKIEPEPDGPTPANDNHTAAEHQRQQRIDRAALAIARIIGRRMARDDFEAFVAANDNRPKTAESPEDEADKD